MVAFRVLVFCRPYLVRDFKLMFGPLEAKFNIHYLTDGRCSGVPNTQKRFYSAYGALERCEEVSSAQMDDIIERCRLLRKLDRTEAERRVHAIAVVLVEALDSIRPEVIFTHTVDEYILATLSHLAQSRAIPFLGYYAAYFPGLLNITTFQFGAPVMVRSPKTNEVVAVHERISPREFRADYGQRLNFSVRSHLLAVMRHHLRRAYLGTKRWIELDPLNMHYQMTPYVADKTRFRDYPRLNDFESDWAARLADLQRVIGMRPVVYFPLAFYPEASTNYWVKNRRMLRFEETTLAILDALADEAILLVKEHPHMLGIRDRSFLAQLRQRTHVISVYAGDHSNQVLEASDLVLVGSGSVGVEATIRAKPVLSFCDSSYWFGASGAHYLDLDDLKALPSKLRAVLAAPDQAVDPVTFLSYCLASTVRLREGGRRWPIANAEDLAELLVRAATGALPDTGAAG